MKDEIENRASLIESEKMNYLMTYTTGKVREVIENYQGLSNSCRLALQVLKQRFGQNAMIVEALKSSVISGPKIRHGNSAALLTLSDKLQKCCWAMIELKSNELIVLPICDKFLTVYQTPCRLNGESQHSCTAKTQVKRSQH